VTPDVRERLSTLFAADGRGVVAVHVFGSVARGEQTAASDIDIAILFAVAPPATLDSAPFTLAADLESRLGRSVDVTVLNTASADLVHRVLRDGEVIIDRDAAARLRFEVAKRNEFFDLEPLRRQYRRLPAPQPADAR
jgi:uncharacterized protein